MDVRRRIELYLQRTKTAPSRVGRDAVNDPRLVSDMRNGREIGRRVGARVTAWLDRQEREA